MASATAAAMRTASIRRSMCELLLVSKEDVPTNGGRMSFVIHTGCYEIRYSRPYAPVHIKYCWSQYRWPGSGGSGRNAPPRRRRGVECNRESQCSSGERLLRGVAEPRSQPGYVVLRR